MADYYRHRRKPTKKPKRYNGIMKWLDTEGVGYITCGDMEIFVTQFSLSSDRVQQGDMVSFSVKPRVSKAPFEAICVQRYGVECRRCLRTGHYSFNCPDNLKIYWINCYKCGFLGHYAENCDQKYYGWNGQSQFSGRFRRSCDCDYGCWLSLFGGSCRKIGIASAGGNIIGNNVMGSTSNLVLGSFRYYWPHLIESCFNSSKNVLGCNDDVKEGGCDNVDAEDDKEEELRYIVCVKKEEEVKKVEEVEDCFILEFDPNGLPNLGNLSLNDNIRVGDDEDELCIVAEKGKRNPAKPERCTGILKWLDTEGVGYITQGENEVFVTPFSFSSDVIKQGDKVSYIVKTDYSKKRLEAVNINRAGVDCHKCLRSGHYFYDCPDSGISSWMNCCKCGLIGHNADTCDQRFCGWFPDKTRNKGTLIIRSCKCRDGCWLSLFGRACRKLETKAGKPILGSASSLMLPSYHFDWPHLTQSLPHSEKMADEEELRYIVCVKKEEDVKTVERFEDCFILEFDPTELPIFGKLSLGDNVTVVDDDQEDVCILAEKGKVACRDYPHSRHLCANKPFKNTPHESHCKMCYCYICDIPAPCKKWTNVSKDGHSLNHCDASDDIEYWRTERELEKKRTEVSQRPTLTTR